MAPLRDLALIATILVGLGLTIRRPYVGVLLWAWFSIMSPNQLGWSFATTLPLNLIIAVVTVGSLLFSREQRLGIFDATFWTVAFFLAWMTFNTFFSVAPDVSWPLWNRTWKI